eukprot:COSAG04_NODE_360_length_15920_cov_50.432815_15_plen_128_part_00
MTVLGLMLRQAAAAIGKAGCYRACAYSPLAQPSLAGSACTVGEPAPRPPAARGPPPTALQEGDGNVDNVEDVQTALSARRRRAVENTKRTVCSRGKRRRGADLQAGWPRRELRAGEAAVRRQKLRSP